jgi:hypothetical protein
MEFDDKFKLFAESDYQRRAELPRLTWLEWLPACEDGRACYAAELPNAAAAAAWLSSFSLVTRYVTLPSPQWFRLRLSR